MGACCQLCCLWLWMGPRLQSSFSTSRSRLRVAMFRQTPLTSVLLVRNSGWPPMADAFGTSMRKLWGHVDRPSLAIASARLPAREAHLSGWRKQRKLATSSLCKAAQDSDGKPLSVNSYVPDLQLPLPSVDGKALASAQAMSGTRWQSSATGGHGLNSSKKDPAQLFREHTERKRARLLRLEWSIFVRSLEFHY